LFREASDRTADAGDGIGGRVRQRLSECGNDAFAGGKPESESEPNRAAVRAGRDPHERIELIVTGLGSDTSHVSHVHSGSCQQPGGILYALNQVVADGTGAADTRTTIQAKYPPASGHWYVVVHAGPDMQGANATYLMCGNLF
jgi:hypothetical protein